jgi:hypothetical protein
VLLMTHPGIGPVTSLAFVLAIGPIRSTETTSSPIRLTLFDTNWKKGSGCYAFDKSGLIL